MSSVRASSRARHDVRQSAPAPQRVGPIEKEPATRVKSSRDCSKCALWVIAQRILTPVTDYSPVDPNCAFCSRNIEITRRKLPGGWIYVCPDCSPQLGPQRPWVDCLFSAMLNLQQAFPNEKVFYHKEEICVYIDAYWDPLCGDRERTSTWWKTARSVLASHSELFRVLTPTDVSGGTGSSRWTLVEGGEEALRRKIPVPTSVTQTRSRSGIIPMQKIPLEDEEEIELRVPIKRSTNATVEGRTLIERAHRLAEEQRLKNRAPPAERGCMHCRIVRAGLWRCSAHTDKPPVCTRKFCTNCIEKFEPVPAESSTAWTCLACRQICRCVRCTAPLGIVSNLFRRKDRRNNKDKREHKKRRVSDYDIAKVVYHGVPMENVRVTSVAAKEIVIPTWRSSEPAAARPSASPVAASPLPNSKNKKRRHQRKSAAPVVPPPGEESGESEELTDDDAFQARHKRAADQLREELFPGKDPAMTRV